MALFRSVLIELKGEWAKDYCDEEGCKAVDGFSMAPIRALLWARSCNLRLGMSRLMPFSALLVGLMETLWDKGGLEQCIEGSW